MLGTGERLDNGSGFYGVFEESAIEHVELPSTLRKIEYGVFEKCKNLRGVVLPDGLEYLGKACFKDSALESVGLPPTLKTIEESAFYNCENLKSAEFSEGIEAISPLAFNKTAVENVTLPASLRTIAQGAFAECKSLKAVQFCEGLETLGTHQYAKNRKILPGVFEESSVEHVELPRTLKRIEYSVFEKCKNLKSINLPGGLEYVGEKCF